jgi:hypothetical protein
LRKCNLSTNLKGTVESGTPKSLGSGVLAINKHHKCPVETKKMGSLTNITQNCRKR